MATKQEQLDMILKNLQMASTEIEGVAIITPDGMLVANHMDVSQMDAEASAAMGAAMTGLGMRVAAALRIGDMQEINIRGMKSSILVFTVAHRAALLVITRARANVGLILLEARKAQQSLLAIL